MTRLHYEFEALPLFGGFAHADGTAEIVVDVGGSWRLGAITFYEEREGPYVMPAWLEPTDNAYAANLHPRYATAAPRPRTVITHTLTDLHVRREVERALDAHCAKAIEQLIEDEGYSLGEYGDWNREHSTLNHAQQGTGWAR
jgi:hypothetical protein